MRVALFRVVSTLVLVPAVLSSARDLAQSTPAATAPLKSACAANSTEPTNADDALRLREYA